MHKIIYIKEPNYYMRELSSFEQIEAKKFTKSYRATNNFIYGQLDFGLCIRLKKSINMKH